MKFPQFCWSGMFIPDPESRIRMFPILDPGNWIQIFSILFLLFLSYDALRICFLTHLVNSTDLIFCYFYLQQWEWSPWWASSLWPGSPCACHRSPSPAGGSSGQLNTQVRQSIPLCMSPVTQPSRWELRPAEHTAVRQSINYPMKTCTGMSVVVFFCLKTLLWLWIE